MQPLRLFRLGHGEAAARANPKLEPKQAFSKGLTNFGSVVPTVKLPEYTDHSLQGITSTDLLLSPSSLKPTTAPKLWHDWGVLKFQAFATSQSTSSSAFLPPGHTHAKERVTHQIDRKPAYATTSEPGTCYVQLHALLHAVIGLHFALLLQTDVRSP